MQIKWREYWPFLDCFMDIRSAEGLTRLEQCLRTNAEKRQQTVTSQATSKESIVLLCAALNDLNVHLEESTPLAKTPPVLMCNPLTGRIVTATQSASTYSAYVCSEKSWQVYARRLTNTIAAAPGNTVNEAHISEALLGELRRLTALVLSYQDDSRFGSVDFSHGHSRFGHLIAGYLIEHHKHTADEAICFFFLHLTIFLNVYPICQIETKLRRIELLVEPNSSSRCVLRTILRHLDDPEKIGQPSARLSEEDARRLWTDEERCSCGWERTKMTGSAISRKGISRRLDAVDAHHTASEVQSPTDERAATMSSHQPAADWSSDDDSDAYLVSSNRKNMWEHQFTNLVTVFV